jgi:hypothetical protein
VFSSNGIHLFDPATPCSYLLPVSPAPAVPLAIPLLLIILISVTSVAY